MVPRRDRLQLALLRAPPCRRRKRAGVGGGIGGDAHFVALAELFGRSDKKSARSAPRERRAADLFSAAQDLERVPLLRREPALAEEFPVPAGEKSRPFADMPLHGAREERFILSEPDAARITAAVVGAREVGKLPACLPPREQGAVSAQVRKGDLV